MNQHLVRTMNGATFNDGAEAIQEARLLRRMMENGELFTFYGSRGMRCPLCFNEVSNHRYKIPCWRYGEWDRYGLHVSATPVGFGRENAQ
jgi:hypothetical protein